MAFAWVNGIGLHHDFRGRDGAPAPMFSYSHGTDFRSDGRGPPEATLAPFRR